MLVVTLVLAMLRADSTVSRSYTFLNHFIGAPKELIHSLNSLIATG